MFEAVFQNIKYQNVGCNSKRKKQRINCRRGPPRIRRRVTRKKERTVRCVRNAAVKNESETHVICSWAALSDMLALVQENCIYMQTKIKTPVHIQGSTIRFNVALSHGNFFQIHHIPTKFAETLCWVRNEQHLACLKCPHGNVDFCEVLQSDG